ncbi:MAG: hypothetical protein B7Z43_07535 [Sphingomonas sp. 12-62-6]|nr:MAG: hypothetical protein B7Z43_07535 [Sphingomonas sp. 12-62-6]
MSHEGHSQIVVALRPARPRRAAVLAGTIGKIIISCDNEKGWHTYAVGVYGPAKGVAAGDWVNSSMEGSKKESFHVKVKLRPDGTAAFTAVGKLSRFADIDADVYDVLAMMLKSKKDMTFRSGIFSLTVPTAGFARAMAPLVKTCGNPESLAKQVRARSEPA